MIDPKDCFGCQIARGTTLPDEQFVYADELVTVNHRLGETPVLGWLILQPRRHVEEFHLLTREERERVTELIAQMDRALRDLLQPAKVFVCLFAESVNCPHVHFHIVPRAPELKVVGPHIFDYRPPQPVTEEEIQAFIERAQHYLHEHGIAGRYS